MNFKAIYKKVGLKKRCKLCKNLNRNDNYGGYSYCLKAGIYVDITGICETSFHRNNYVVKVAIRNYKSSQKRKNELKKTIKKMGITKPGSH